MAAAAAAASASATRRCTGPHVGRYSTCVTGLGVFNGRSLYHPTKRKRKKKPGKRCGGPLFELLVCGWAKAGKVAKSSEHPAPVEAECVVRFAASGSYSRGFLHCVLYFPADRFAAWFSPPWNREAIARCKQEHRMTIVDVTTRSPHTDTSGGIFVTSQSKFRPGLCRYIKRRARLAAIVPFTSDAVKKPKPAYDISELHIHITTAYLHTHRTTQCRPIRRCVLFP